jgi:glycerophosphoryl diester phosphodiesterase
LIRIRVCIATIAVLSAGIDSAPADTALPTPYVSADQGGGAYAPENTMVAMRNAIRLGVDELETDINMTKDYKLVLIHDGSLDRTTNCTGNVSAFMLADLAQCDAAYWWTPGIFTLLPGALSALEHDAGASHPMRGMGVGIPTAEEFFAYISSLGERAPQVTVEIKNIPYDSNFDPLGTTMADELVPLIHSYPGLAQKIVVESFWPASIERVKQLDPSIRTMFLTLGSAMANYAYAATAAAEFSSSDTIAPDLTQVYVDAVHALGKKVVPWLVDAAADWDKIKTFGVDGVISSYPACIMQAMGRPVAGPFITPEAGLADPGTACA